MNRFLKLFFAVPVMFAVSCSGGKYFSDGDLQIIRSNPDDLLHIYTVGNPNELAVLEARSEFLSMKALRSSDYSLLVGRMVKTVSDSAVGGVGLAAPQIGINKAVIVVQRVDKEGEPFEVYPNIKITSMSPEKEVMREGCLSVPDMPCEVERSLWVAIEYYNHGTGTVVRDTVRGYAARIFQHETDHLYGKLIK